MVKVIGVRLRRAGKVYYFAPGEREVNRNDHVIVETAQGVEYGKVVLSPRELPDDQIVKPLKEIIRVATKEDDQKYEENKKKEKEAAVIANERIKNHGLEMKLLGVEYTFDNNKVLFYFTADGRVDFRELVKDLAAVFRTRIELRQVGVRDETKFLGGVGICGRPFCCHTYLGDFAPVSIKMAKDQNLSLNPTKISGVCGRLMCCLRNEQDTYEYLNKQLPRIGDWVTAIDGKTGEVQSVNVIRQKVKLVITNGDDKEISEYDVSDLKDRRSGKRRDFSVETQVSKEEEEALADLLDEDSEEKVIKEARKGRPNRDHARWDMNQKKARDPSRGNRPKSENHRPDKGRGRFRKKPQEER